MTQLSANQTTSSWLDRPLAQLMRLDVEKMIYLLFIIIAIVSRFYGLGDRAVSHDESLHTQYSYQFYNGDGYTHTPLMHGPFLFHATAASYWLFGDNDFTSRIPVALFGVLLVIFPWFFRHWLGRTGALFASFFLLVSPYITYYSRYIRHDIYVIIWAMIVFTATMYYIRQRREVHLWWFAGGVSMMFATKEVSFIYVAIFGSFLVIRLLALVLSDEQLRNRLLSMTMPLMLALGGVVVLGGGLIGSTFVPEHEEGVEAASSMLDTGSSVAQAIGLILLGVGLFLLVKNLKQQLEKFPEFDIIVLYTTLVLPTMTAFIVSRFGVDPRDYTVRSCQLAGQEDMNPAVYLVSWVTQGQCWSALISSPIFTTGIVLAVFIGISIAVGLWWGGTRWIMPAVIFHVLFALFYTSLFTNNQGWLSGMVGSLGYWLEQQGVERGSQPQFYYLFVTPLYEFMPVVLSLLGIRLWLRQQRLSGSISYWISAVLLAYLGYGFTTWLFTRNIGGQGISTTHLVLVFIVVAISVGARLWTSRAEPEAWHRPMVNTLTGLAIIAIVTALANTEIDNLITNPTTGLDELRTTTPYGIIAALIILAISAAWFILIQRPQLREEAEANPVTTRSVESLTGFVPYVIWWLLLTWGAYTWAGEKMPWLSTHIAVPTTLLAGWYLGVRIKEIAAEKPDWLNRQAWMQIGVMTTLLIVGFLSLQSILIDVDLGSQTRQDLASMGAFFGRVAVILLLVYVLQTISAETSRRQINLNWLMASVIVLSFLTVRATYMANYINGDYTNEFLVYAHGSPATKNQVMRQLDEISMRLEGDKTIRVSFDNKSSWPYYWYLREYSNQHFFGENPDASITESPVILAGSDKWDEVENILRDEYEAEVYHYIWWPMEEYRQFSWGALFGIDGDPNKSRGLGSRDVRAAMWDIFFYRDYDKYGEVFGGTYTDGQWPLRADLKMYIRRDVLAKLWDSGLTATAYVPPADPYAQGEVFPVAEQIIGGFGQGAGQLQNPRNVAVNEAGRIFVTDSGNHRLVAFNPDGSEAFSVGGFGAEPGLFNEPWGITVDEENVYVADTWNGRIQVFTHDGEFVSTFGRFEIPAEGTAGELQFYGPRSVALAPDNGLYIMDTGNHRIQVVGRDGTYRNQVGTEGFELGQFNEPVGLATDNSDAIYVAEAWSRRIQTLDSNLQPFYEWSIDAWQGNSLDNKPYITIDNTNRIYITDPEGHQVLIFNLIGEYLGRFGKFGTDATSFNLPTGITTDVDDNVYVVDTYNHRVLKFASPDLSPIPPVQGGSVDQ